MIKNNRKKKKKKKNSSGLVPRKNCRPWLPTRPRSRTAAVAYFCFRDTTGLVIVTGLVLPFPPVALEVPEPFVNVRESRRWELVLFVRLTMATPDLPYVLLLLFWRLRGMRSTVPPFLLVRNSLRVTVLPRSRMPLPSSEKLALVDASSACRMASFKSPCVRTEMRSSSLSWMSKKKKRFYAYFQSLAILRCSEY